MADWQKQAASILSGQSVSEKVAAARQAQIKRRQDESRMSALEIIFRTPFHPLAHDTKPQTKENPNGKPKT